MTDYLIYFLVVERSFRNTVRTQSYDLFYDFVRKYCMNHSYSILIIRDSIRSHDLTAFNG